MKRTSKKKKKNKCRKKSFSSKFVPKRSPHLISRLNPDRTVAILDLKTDAYFFSLDGVSAEIWELINDKRTFGEIAQKIAKKYNAPLAHIAEDFEELLTGLSQEHLILR